MAEIWWIYLNDWRNLFRIPVAVLLIAALIVLPSVYDWVNVAAVWDPYSNTSGIKIAVASLDKGAELQGKSFRAFLSNPESFYAVYLCDQSAAGSGWGVFLRWSSGMRWLCCFSACWHYCWGLRCRNRLNALSAKPQNRLRSPS